MSARGADATRITAEKVVTARTLDRGTAHVSCGAKFLLMLALEVISCQVRLYAFRHVVQGVLFPAATRHLPPPVACEAAGGRDS